MKVVILAGGIGSRLSEETGLTPKPMIKIGDKPILWHIMKIYSYYGFNEFVICLGYKGYTIKEYFTNYFLHQTDITIDITNNSTEFHHSNAEPWKITLVDTGLNTMTGGRIKRIQNHIGNETFLLTYGDGISNVNIKKLIEFHQNEKNFATVTAVQPLGRFGTLNIQNNNVNSFIEKPTGDGTWINGGFFVLEPKVFDYIDGDQTLWEKEPLEKLAQDKQLKSFKHFDFWKPMDTLRDKRELEKLWESGDTPWRLWND